uniref:Uncharacterized protein n=1 Tax=Pinguiococcus pyrenoidosus TaxID=172671 RepID=A0A7R9UF82_9STRA
MAAKKDDAKPLLEDESAMHKMMSCCNYTYNKLPEVVQTSIGFVVDQSSWSFSMLMTHILFWVYAFPLFAQYGYVDVFDDNGGVPSGPSGSGAFPVIVMLMVIVTVLYAKKYIEYDPKVSWLRQFPTGPDGEPLVPHERLPELEKFKDD